MSGKALLIPAAHSFRLEASYLETAEPMALPGSDAGFLSF